MANQYFAFQWHITDQCDQRCKHCYIFAEGHFCLVSMTWEEMLVVVEKCQNFCKKFNRLPYFYITGGDPILHKNFWQLLELLKEKKIPFTLMGNPFHLNDEVCQKLRSYGCDKYQMSIDGMEKTHDWFRKPGSFKCTLEKVSSINKAGITSVIMSTVSSMNIKEIPDVIDAIVKAGVDVYAFARYVPTSSEKSTGIKPEEYRDFLKAVDKKYKEYEKAGCKTYFNRKDHLWTLYQYETGEFKIPENTKEGMIYSGCNCGNCHFTISSKGELMACRRVANSIVGNIFTDKIEDVWLNQMEAYRDYEKFSKCSKCKLLAWCRGCPAVAAGSNGGDFYSEDPQCWMKVS
ncbi:MAG: radical SAM/SPASM domain protein, ACGX system [Treponema sp.]|nr:radical SAM/SPASM domain protein, ACGX system [Treponema sp.]